MTPTDPGIEREEQRYAIQQILQEYSAFHHNVVYAAKEIQKFIAATVRQSNKELLERLKAEKRQLSIEQINGSVLVVPVSVIDAELTALQPPQPASKEEHEDT